MLQSTVQEIIKRINYRIQEAGELHSEIKELIIIIHDPPARPKVVAELVFMGESVKGAIVKTTKITIEGQPAAVELITAKIRELWPAAYESKDSPVNN